MFGKFKSTNTRSYKRLRADYLLKYWPADEPAAEPWVSNLVDISAGGMRFWSEALVPEDRLLQITMWLPPIDRTLEVQAHVLRTRQARNTSMYYVAVKFEDLPDSDKGALNSFIETLSQIPGARPLVDNKRVVKRGKIA